MHGSAPYTIGAIQHFTDVRRAQPMVAALFWGWFSLVQAKRIPGRWTFSLKQYCFPSSQIPPLHLLGPTDRMKITILIQRGITRCENCPKSQNSQTSACFFPSTQFPELQIPQSTVLLELPPDPSINLNGVLF